MEGDAGYGQAEDPTPWLRGDFVTGYDFLPYDPIRDFFPYIPVGAAGPLFLPTGYYGPGASLPQVPDQSGAPSVPGPGNQQDPGPTTVDPEAPPDQGPGPAIPDDEGGIIDFPWWWPQNPFFPDQEEQQVAIDWGDIIGSVADAYFNPPQNIIQQPISYPRSPIETYPSGGVPASQIDPVTGKIKCKRRRRRRLLTSSDLADLASLKAIVGGGAAMNAAVVKAVRR